jgi:DNA-directed RNA polymerase sigma subunit (sigma70/sigma32)
VRKRRDIGLELVVGRVDDQLTADLALARIALGVWRARNGVERRVAELRSLLARIEIDAPKRRALEAFLEEDLARLADAPPDPESEDAAIERAEYAIAQLIERYLQMVVDMVDALGREATYGRYLDFIQEGNIALEQAVRTFSPVLGRDEFEKHARERVARALATALGQDGSLSS